MPRKLSEHDVQTQILDHLKHCGVFAWRNNTGAFKKGKHYIRFGCPGSPDIMALHRGQFVGIEVKKKGQLQTWDQKGFQMAVERSGNRYILAYSLEDVIEGLK